MTQETNNILNKPNTITPKHVGIIMDGNGRWAQQRGKKRTFGHKSGVENTRKVVELCANKGIESLTLFAFSSENWARPEEEVSYLMELFVMALKREVKMLNKNNAQLKFIGDIQGFNPKLRESIRQAEASTKKNDGLHLNIAANYGGRWDIVNAANRAIKKLPSNAALSESDLESELATSGLPELDLMIRTGGEKRISNFLIWQAAYAELYFSEKLWPDFDEVELDNALDDFAQRQRRYGKTGEQVS